MFSFPGYLLWIGVFVFGYLRYFYGGGVVSNQNLPAFIAIFSSLYFSVVFFYSCLSGWFMYLDFKKYDFLRDKVDFDDEKIQVFNRVKTITHFWKEVSACEETPHHLFFAGSPKFLYHFSRTGVDDWKWQAIRELAASRTKIRDFRLKAGIVLTVYVLAAMAGYFFALKYGA